MRELRVVAEHKNVWQLIFPESVAQADRETIRRKPIRPAKPLHSFTSQQFQDEYHNFQIDATDYELSLSEYNEQQKRLREARTLLLATLTPTMRRFVRNEMVASEILAETRALYQPTDSQARQVLYQELDLVFFQYDDSTNITDCVNSLTNIHRELRSLEGEACDEEFVAKVFGVLPRSYFDGFESLRDRYCERARLPRVVRTLFAKLLVEEARLEKEGKLRYTIAKKGRKG